ncbi:MAG: 50S ribosomal protein L29 [Bacteroidales bacterium]|nr:50S ribosomal protein L29 [Bacteroidales bacterium]
MKNELVLKELSTSELKEKLDNERNVYQKMLLTHAVSPLENPNKIKESRRNIARYLTELRAREIAEQK